MCAIVSLNISSIYCKNIVYDTRKPVSKRSPEKKSLRGKVTVFLHKRLAIVTSSVDKNETGLKNRTKIAVKMRSMLDNETAR